MFCTGLMHAQQTWLSCLFLVCGQLSFLRFNRKKTFLHAAKNTFVSAIDQGFVVALIGLRICMITIVVSQAEDEGYGARCRAFSDVSLCILFSWMQDIICRVAGFEMPTHLAQKMKQEKKKERR